MAYVVLSWSMWTCFTSWQGGQECVLASVGLAGGLQPERAGPSHASASWEGLTCGLVSSTARAGWSLPS